MVKQAGKGRSNIYFRQTPKEFKAQRQTEVYEHIKMNLPYRIFAFTKTNLTTAFTKVHGHIKRFTARLPKEARKVS